MFFKQRPKSHSRSKRVQLSLEVLESRLVPTAPAGNDLIWKSYTSAEAFSLESNPGAAKVIYLDFDGHLVSGTSWNTSVNGGAPFLHEAWSGDADRTTFTTAERNKIIAMWRRVAEDFVPFDVNVTTADPGIEALRKTGGSDTTWGIRVVIGPKPTVSNPSATWSGAGGIAYLNSFDDSIDTPCFVWNGDGPAWFSDAESVLPTTVSHEVGHTLGLSHDGTSSVTYYPGHGSGATSWGAIMGAAFYIALDQWSMNTYPDADNGEDDLAIIANSANGFGYRPDDYGGNTASAHALNGHVQTTLTTTYGIIEKNTDADYFKFYAGAGAINIAIDPLFVGANLDILAELRDASDGLVASSNPSNLLNASFSTTVARGEYYIKIVGTGLPGPTGYTNYGSLGNYRITGSVVSYNEAPVVDLDGPGGGTGFTATFTEGGSPVAIGDTDLTVSDVDHTTLASATVTITNLLDGAAESLTFTPVGGITGNYVNGVLTLTGTASLANYQQVLRSVRYSNSSGAPNTTARTISVVVNDGIDSSAAATSVISLVAVNTAPTLVNSFDMTLGSILEDATTNAGTSISTLLLSSGADRITDPDSIARGIAVFFADTTHGRWEYTINNGVLWSDLGSVTDSSARLLAADGNTRLRFVPHLNYNGSISRAIEFRAWDQFSGSNGGLADIRTNGTPTAFSTETEIASLVVTPVADSAVIDLNGPDAAGDNFSASFTEGGTGVLIADSDATIFNVDRATLSSMTITISNRQDGALESLSATAAGAISLSFSSSTGVLTLTGVDLLSSYLTVLKTVVYSNSSLNPGTTARNVQVVANDGVSSSNTAICTINVTSVNVAPTGLVLSSTSLSENQPSGATVGTFTTTDADPGNTHTYTLVSGTGSEDNAAFTIVGNQLRTAAVFDFEVRSSYSIRVETRDQGGLAFERTFTITVTNANEAPQLIVTPILTSVSETATGNINVATITISDDALGTNVLSLTGLHASSFQISGNQLVLLAGAGIDFETTSQLQVTVILNDVTVGATPDGSFSMAVNIIDVNEAPTLQLANALTALPENADTSVPIKIADLIITDDALGAETISLNGADAALFEVIGSGLFLAADATLDFNVNRVLDVTVSIDDSTVGGTPDGSASLSITVAPVVTANATRTLLDDNDERYLVRLIGPGQAAVAIDDADGDGNGAIAQIILTGTDPARSQLMIGVIRHKQNIVDGLVHIGSIQGSGLASISAPGSDIVGAGINISGLGTLSVRNIMSGAAITIGGTAVQKSTIRAGTIGSGVTIATGRSLSLSATAVGDSAINAGAIGKLAVRGGFAADVTVPGNVGSATVGSVANATWIIGGNLGAVSARGAVSNWSLRIQGSLSSIALGATNQTFISAGSSVLKGTAFTAAEFKNSQFLVGFTPTNTNDPMAGGTFTSTALVKSFTITGRSQAFHNSTVAAARIGTAKLTSVDASGSDPTMFGILADTLTRVIAPQLVFNPGLPTQGYGRFQVRIV